jgi:hypothetical protein
LAKLKLRNEGVHRLPLNVTANRGTADGLVVGRARHAEDLYVVVSDSGRAYLVDAREGRCECDDHFYRGARCTHIRRVDYATGRRPLPSWVNRDAVDPLLGAHVDA